MPYTLLPWCIHIHVYTYKCTYQLYYLTMYIYIPYMYRYVHIYCDINELLGSYSCDLITRFSVSFEEGRCIKSIFCNMFTLYLIRYQKFLAKPLAVYLMMFPGCLWLQPQLKLLLLSNGMWEHHRLTAFPVFSQASIILWMFP